MKFPKLANLLHGLSYKLVDCPGLDGISLHAISRGFAEIKRKRKRVTIRFNIDMVNYFTCLLKTLKERGTSPELLTGIQRIIASQKAFDPLKGSSRFADDAAFDEVVQKYQPAWKRG